MAVQMVMGSRAHSPKETPYQFQQCGGKAVVRMGINKLGITEKVMDHIYAASNCNQKDPPFFVALSPKKARTKIMNPRYKIAGRLLRTSWIHECLSLKSLNSKIPNPLPPALVVLWMDEILHHLSNPGMAIPPVNTHRRSGFNPGFKVSKGVFVHQ